MSLRATVREPKQARTVAGRRGPRARDVRAARASGRRRAGFARVAQPTAGGARSRSTFAATARAGRARRRGRSWTYEDLVRRDLPAVVEGARARAEREAGDRRRALARRARRGGGAGDRRDRRGRRSRSSRSNVWLRRDRAVVARGALAKLAIARAMEAVRRASRLLPGALRFAWEATTRRRRTSRRSGRGVVRGFWGSEDGRDGLLGRDARRARSALRARERRRPDQRAPGVRGALRAARGGERDDSIAFATSDDGAAAPGHMEIVTTARSTSAWGQAGSGGWREL